MHQTGVAEYFSPVRVTLCLGVCVCRQTPGMMYRRLVLSVWEQGGRRSVRGSCGSRHSDHVQRWFGSCSVLRCENPKNPPETSSAPEQQNGTPEKQPQPSKKENLLNVIGDMKVELSSRRKFQAMKTNRNKEPRTENMESMESASSMFQRVAEESHTENTKPLNPDLVAAVSAVAESLPSNKKQIESELLQQLRKHEQETDAQKRCDSLGNIISDMKVKKHPELRISSWHSNQIRFDEDGRGYTHDRGVTQELAGVRRRGLYSGRRLNIFPVFADPEQPTGTEQYPSLWDVELANTIASTSEQPPKNGFEEMIQWTKQGKLWTFPIDNEAGLDEEQKVEFHEHIFLDKYLEDFPKQGPIRHFMELVVCGLSKNPYLSVKQKREHIEWYQDYFQQKEDILKECEVYLN
ncbi:28S ribosomal protein S31, mitochondrial isoform X2 [Xenopus laevis]|uniref:Small ribosomal subunit protein mS31 n=1 Tax=Xenopus laevis TaxID=8355 RepID=A0A8J0UKP7_XENLA|nr:28S ribosomal protein S31, mitochondrial isoform X2 [Xenopus laevis]